MFRGLHDQNSRGLPRRYLSLPGLVAAVEPLKSQAYQLIAAHLTPDAIDFRELDYARPTAILRGAERQRRTRGG